MTLSSTQVGLNEVNSSSLQLEEREKERAAFATMQRPDFDGSGGTKIQGNMHETWLDKLKKGWQQEPLLPLVPVGKIFISDFRVPQSMNLTSIV